jgi:hypothetical protein
VQWYRTIPAESTSLTEIGPAESVGILKGKEPDMLETILIILVIMWALGLFAFHAGGIIHVLLIIALVVLIIRLLQGRRVL